jgi:hypothetical protein
MTRPPEPGCCRRLEAQFEAIARLARTILDAFEDLTDDFASAIRIKARLRKRLV